MHAMEYPCFEERKKDRPWSAFFCFWGGMRAVGKAERHVWLYAVFPLRENSLFQTSPGIASTQLNPVHTCHAGDFQPQVCLSGIGL